MDIKQVINEFTFDALCVRALHYLWDIKKNKRIEIVKGVKIYYMKVPTFLLRKEFLKSKYFRGVTFYCRSKDTTTIFVAGSDDFLRYTVFHEYHEGMLIKQRKSKEEIVVTLNSKAELIKKALQGVFPEITLEETKEVIGKMVERYNPHAHAEAIMEELLLAQEELPENDFIILRNDIIDRLK